MISITNKNKVDIISFTISRIDGMITEEIRESINNVIYNSNPNIIIDLKGVEYIDSSGFGCFLSVMKSARNNYGILKFANAEPGIKELFKILHLHTIFQIFDDIDTCLLSFK